VKSQKFIEKKLKIKNAAFADLLTPAIRRLQPSAQQRAASAILDE
jgi:hypothetical protein